MSLRPWPEAHALAYDSATALPAVTLPVAETGGCVLAAPLLALAAVPAFDVAAMDGYAVAGDGPWSLRGRVLAGRRWDGVLGAGDAVEIATGAAVPAGTGAVLPYERADVRDAVVTGALEPGRNIRRAGEECRPGDLLLTAGTRLSPLALGLAAAVGHDRLAVVPVPTVALLVTGDELLTAGLPDGSRIRDALGPALPGLVTALGGHPSELRHVGDGAAPLRSALGAAATDVVVTTGASSVGRADHLADVLRSLGAELLVDGVACRPGHPQSLARLPDGRWVVGLPGNPLAAAVATVTLLAPLLAALSGRPRPQPEPAVSAAALASRPDVTRLVPVVPTRAGVEPVGHHGPAMLRGAAVASALAVVAPGTDVAAAGRVDVLPLPGAVSSQPDPEAVRQM